MPPVLVADDQNGLVSNAYAFKAGGARFDSRLRQVMIYEYKMSVQVFEMLQGVVDAGDPVRQLLVGITAFLFL